jgi:hypothetical protein
MQRCASTSPRPRMPAAQGIAMEVQGRVYEMETAGRAC